MTDPKSRTQEQIFLEMFREMRSWNREISESPDRMDPILRILLELYSSQLAKIDSRVDQLWDVATESLLRSVCPETRRWPVPAYTVMQCDLVDPLVDIDRTTKFFFREKREGGGMFFFTPHRPERLINAKVVGMFASTDSGTPTPVSDNPSAASNAERLFVAVEYDGQITDAADTTVYLHGPAEAVRQIRWARWFASAADGSFVTETGFCPGRQETLERMFGRKDHRAQLWGSFRSNLDIFRSLKDHFVVLPGSFVEAWKSVPAGTPLDGETAPKVEGEGKPCYWIELRLPEGGDRRKIAEGTSIEFGSFVVINRNEITEFKHTAGNRVIDVEIPQPLEQVAEIVSVIDSQKNEYRPRYEMTTDRVEHSYTLQDNDERLILWFDYTSQMAPPPDSITIHYTLTEGTKANGIDHGAINELYESHPGISDCRNLIPTGGAIPAKSSEQVVTEVSTRLRSRDRAMTFKDIAAWAKSFDPRIRDVACENGVQRTTRGIRRCVVVQLEVHQRDFHSSEETDLLRERVIGFLKDRSAINTHYTIELVQT